MKPNVTVVVCDSIGGPVGQSFLSAPVAKIVAVDDGKARELAEFFSKNLSSPKVSTTGALREWDSGIGDRSELLDDVNSEPLGGESFVAFQTRVLKAVVPLFREAKAHPDKGTIAVVAGKDVARLVEGWCKAGCLTDGTVDVQAFVEDAPAKNLIAQWDGSEWSCKNTLDEEDKKEKQMNDPFVGVVEELGFETQQFVSNLAKTGSDIYESEMAAKAKAKAEADAKIALARSLSADAAWANAEATYIVNSTPATQAARDSSKSAADKAAQSLSADGVSKRCESAQNNVHEAATAATTYATDAGKQAQLQAWQRVAAACSSMASKGGGIDKHGGESWLTKRYANIPGWGWGLVGVGGLVLLVLIARGFFKRSK